MKARDEEHGGNTMNMSAYDRKKSPKVCVACGRTTQDYHYRTITLFADTGKTQQTIHLLDRRPVCKQCDKKVTLLLNMFGAEIGILILKMLDISKISNFDDKTYTTTKKFRDLMVWMLRIVITLVHHSNNIKELFKGDKVQSELLFAMDNIKNSIFSVRVPETTKTKKLVEEFIEVAKSYNFQHQA